MHWTVNLIIAAAAALPGFTASTLAVRRRRRRQHLIEHHYGPAMFVFPDQVVEVLVNQVRWAAEMGARGSGVSVAHIPGVGAAWLRLELTPDGDILRSAGYAKSVRAARRLHGIPPRGPG